MEPERSSAPEAFKALGDPVRWTIVRHMAETPELAGSALDDLLSISRPTISYHIRILTQAGLVEVSKRGRNHYYTLRHDVLRTVLAELNALMPGLELVHDATGEPWTIAVVDSESAPELTKALPTW
ncbi:ArsR/SmtB family transcription factor [Nocardioides sp. P5_C9_2]